MNIEEQAKEILEETSKAKSSTTKPRKPIVRKRIDGLIENLPKNNFKIMPSAIEAGYSPHTAKNTNVLKASIQNRLAELKELGIELPQDTYFNIGELMEEYEYITTQRKDLSTKLKAITPILQKHKIIPATEADNARAIPPLIIGIRELNVLAPQSPNSDNEGKSPISINNKDKT